MLPTLVFCVGLSRQRGAWLAKQKAHRSFCESDKHVLQSSESVWEYLKVKVCKASPWERFLDRHHRSLHLVFSKQVRRMAFADTRQFQQEDTVKRCSQGNLCQQISQLVR